MPNKNKTEIKTIILNPQHKCLYVPIIEDKFSKQQYYDLKEHRKIQNKVIIFTPSINTLRVNDVLSPIVIKKE